MSRATKVALAVLGIAFGVFSASAATMDGSLSEKLAAIGCLIVLGGIVGVAVWGAFEGKLP